MKLTHALHATSSFLPGFFQGGSIVMQISIVILIFYCFWTIFLGGGQKSLGGPTSGDESQISSFNWT